MRFTKGHGTENDFVLVADPDGARHLDAATVARICDRYAGIGADGLIRVVRTAALGEPAPAGTETAEWFMDYRNADGSVAEMCGNGVRVFTAYLLREGLVPSDALAGGLAVGSRGGVKRVTAAADGWIAVDMGQWRLTGGDRARSAGHDATVHVRGLDVARPALSLDLGNPHTVVALAHRDELAAADLTRAPAVEPVPVHGTNVELVVPLDSEDAPDGPVGRLRMRVHERGVGETRSCGTGACAAALAARAWAGDGAPSRWLVDVPGGTVGVRVLDGGRVELSGPAVLVADGELDERWLAGA
ncbi:MAG: diaminopimelate epimerase [Actinomycetes bacterium]